MTEHTRQISLVDHTDDEAADTPRPPLPPEEHSHIDVLYENQRGWFIFGLPLFSSRALWNFKLDKAPWQDENFKPSAVNITNAQVPDPSWTWEWKTWYVDMSHDVDEEGWQYSFWFRGGAAWHGNHPWFHSFVRRRRWLRKRIKQKLPPKSKDKRDRLFGETFSVGTTMMRTSTHLTTSGDSTGADTVDEEITTVQRLMQVLKKSAIDREKIVAINKFIDEGGDQLHHLPEQIPNIMSMLIFQNSRRQLLSNLMDVFDAAKDHRKKHKDRGKPETEEEERKINNLLRTIEAADAECKKLEYWSDIRELVESGDAGHATDTAHGWDGKWEGLDKSGAPHPPSPPLASSPFASSPPP